MLIAPGIISIVRTEILDDMYRPTRASKTPKLCNRPCPNIQSHLAKVRL